MLRIPGSLAAALPLLASVACGTDTGPGSPYGPSAGGSSGTGGAPSGTGGAGSSTGGAASGVGGAMPGTGGAGGCAQGLTACGGGCVNTQSSPEHCGGCGRACGENQVCASGSCSGAGCPPGQTQCDAACADLNDDAAHCGMCGRACAAGQSCQAGQCTPPGDCSDSCAFAGGIAWNCRKRFMYGVNYAWQNFAIDFGGGSGNQRGVAANRDTVGSTLGTMSQNGASVVRWWVWPDFRGDGVTFDGSGTPSGLGGTALADLEAALSLAAQHDLYLMLTLFSFDNFKSALPADRSLSTIALDTAKRGALVERVVRPFARAAAQSPNASRLISWDVMNEPEWAVTGASPYGDEDFDPTGDLRPITHAQMETLLRDVIAGLRAESEALITVGGAAMKWRYAWSRLDLDFYQFHSYDWVNEYWPYDDSPAEFGVTDKPIVMGEFPPDGLMGASYRTLVESWYQNGYAGALVWRDSQLVVNWSDVKSFADAHTCETQY